MTKKSRFETPVEEEVALALTELLEDLEDACGGRESPELITDIDAATAKWLNWRRERFELINLREKLATDGRTLDDRLSALDAELP